MIISFVPLADLRYPSMRGFPIVSLPSLVSYSEVETDGWKQTKVQIPKFEVDEYHNGSSEIAISFWTNKYSEANNYNYLKSFDILENNLNATSGVMPKIMASDGFYYSTPYGNIEKALSIKKMRVDSFYLYYLNHHFYQSEFILGTRIDNLYFNLPNVMTIQTGFNLSLYEEIDNIYLNIPRAILINNFNLDGPHKVETINLNYDRNLLKMEASSFSNWPLQNTIINCTNIGNIDEILNKYESSKNENALVTFVKGTGSLDLSEFEIRYWDLWQNESGSDR